MDAELTVPAEGRSRERMLEVLEPAVNQLFTATLDLSSIAAASDPDVAQALLDVIDLVDDAIRQLRHDLIVEAVPDGETDQSLTVRP